MVWRNPLLSTLAHFHMQRVSKGSSLQTLDEFIKAANDDNSLQRIFQNTVDEMVKMMKRLSSSGKPLLVISYEDMRGNLPVQLLRLIHFIGKDADCETLDRVFCTVQSEAKMAAKLNTRHKLDLTKTATEIIGERNVTESFRVLVKLSAGLGLIHLEN